MAIDRSIQKKILDSLKPTYPNWTHSPTLQVGCELRELAENLAYLHEDGLIEAKWTGTVGIGNVKLTKKGIDSLNNDGGRRVMGLGTPAQQALVKRFFEPFFHWEDDEKLRGWLRQQDPDELEQFLNWFNFSSHRDRQTLGRQELAKLRRAAATAPPAPTRSDVLIARPTIWGMGIDLNEMWRRLRSWYQNWRWRQP
jgi:hypothetical protein